MRFITLLKYLGKRKVKIRKICPTQYGGGALSAAIGKRFLATGCVMDTSNPYY
jgi:hypothetical protein